MSLVSPSKFNFSSRSDTRSATLSVYIVIVVSMAIWTVWTRLQFSIDGDDALRLVQVRDLLADQGWFDLTQHRLGLDGGTAIHLSRLADVPFAGLILVFDLFLDREGAEALAMMVWPASLFCIVVACLYAICFRLGGAKAAVYGATLASIAIVQTGKFDPGSLSHGNLQMTLLMVAIVGFIMRRLRLLASGAGGVSVAFSLSIGPEVAPQLLVVLAAFPVVWMLRGHSEKHSLMTFALSMAVTSALVLSVSPSSSVFCEGFATAALFTSLGLLVLAGALSNAEQRARLLAVAVLGVTLPVCFWLLDARCSGVAAGTIDALVRGQWLDHVMDTKSISGFESSGTGARIGCGVGWLISVWFVRRDIRRDPWMLLCLMLGVTLVVTAFEGHTSAVLSMLTILPTSILAARLIERGNPDAGIWKSVVSIAVLLMSIPAITGAANAMIDDAGHARDVRSQDRTVHPFAKKVWCDQGGDYAGLAGLEKGLVLAPLELAPFILLYTSHSVVPDAFYQLHRDDLAVAQDNAQFGQAGITYVVRCRRNKQHAEDNDDFRNEIKRGLADGALKPMRLKRAKDLSIYRVH